MRVFILLCILVCVALPRVMGHCQPAEQESESKIVEAPIQSIKMTTEGATTTMESGKIKMPPNNAGSGKLEALDGTKMDS